MTKLPDGEYINKKYISFINVDYYPRDTHIYFHSVGCPDAFFITFTPEERSLADEIIQDITSDSNMVKLPEGTLSGVRYVNAKYITRLGLRYLDNEISVYFYLLGDSDNCSVEFPPDEGYLAEELVQKLLIASDVDIRYEGVYVVSNIAEALCN